jgi:hypothetical protein
VLQFPLPGKRRDAPPATRVGLAEVAIMLRVSKNTALLYSRREDFPAPAERPARGRIWHRGDVEAWAKRTLPIAIGRPKALQNQSGLTPEVREYFRNLGLRGGKIGGPVGGRARARKLTAEQRQKIASRAARARWAKTRKPK